MHKALRTRRARFGAKELTALRGFTAGALVTVALLILRSQEFLSGLVGLGMVAIFVVLIPISTNLSRRILLSGAILIGWLPIAWWSSVGPAEDRWSLILALGYGALTWWVLGRRNVGLRLKQLAPRLRIVDAIPLATALAAVWLFSPLLTSPSNNRTLSLIMKSGWDHVAHFYVVDRISASVSFLNEQAQAPDGSDWVGTSYPKHFHLLVNAISELTAGPGLLGTNMDIREYGQGLAIVLVVVVVLIAAGLAQLPGLINRPQWAFPLIAIPIAGFLFGPGAVAVTTGYPNFVLACATVGLTACVALGMARVFQPIHALALMGLLVATAHSWLLILPLAFAAAAVVLLPLKKSRWRASKLQVALTLLVAISGIIAGGIAALIALPSLKQSSLLLGTNESFPTGMTLGMLLAVLSIGMVAARANWNRAGSDFKLRAGAISFVPVVAIGLLLYIGVRQVQESGTLLYFFTKLASGVMLACVILIVIVISALLSHRVARPALGGRVATAALASLATIATLQSFGYVGPSFGGVIVEQAAGIKYRSDSQIIMSTESPEANRLLSAAEIAKTQPFGETLYLGTLDGDVLPELGSQWHMSLAGTWSLKSELLTKYLSSEPMLDAIAAGDLAPGVQYILESDPVLKIIVAPENYTAIETELPSALRERVLTW